MTGIPFKRQRHSAWFGHSLLLLALGSFTGPVMATGDLHMPLGQDLSYGGGSNPNSVQTMSNNPASPVAFQRGGVWFGLNAMSTGYEVGRMDNIMARVESLQETLNDENMTLQEAQEAKAEFDQLLEDLGRDGYVQTQAAYGPPLAPLGTTFPRLGGIISVDAKAFGGGRASFLDDPVKVVPDGTSAELQTRSSAYVKGGAGAKFSLGYSGGIFHSNVGSLFVGGRLSHITMELAKGVVALQSAQNDDFGAELQEDLGHNRRRDTALGMDLGAVWTAKHYRLGATMRNLNKPTFRYPLIGHNCDAPSLSQTAEDNCYTAASFGDRINLEETYTMNRQLQLSGGLYSENQRWHVNVAADANSTRDPMGNERQWATVSTGYAGTTLIPGVRVGYRSNLTDEGLNYITGGLTFFRALNLDAAVSRETIETDGVEVPRSAHLSASLELRF